MQAITDHLDRWATDFADRTAFTFLARGEREAAAVSYGALRRHALKVAFVLGERDLAGRPVMLVFPPGLDFIAAFVGCLYAGAIAVPAPYLFPGRKAERIGAISRDAGCDAVLSIAALADDPDPDIDAELGGVPWIAIDRLPERPGETVGKSRPALDDLAMLQYTSGSTAEPRGVVITHGNLAANQAMIESAFQHDAGSSLVSWLPMYHDMGLIGGVLQPLVLGRPAVLMSPLAFLQKPARWLAAISKYRATTSGAPSFAYGLCARTVTPEQKAALDLRSWRVAFCGAEPVRAADIDAFSEAFAGRPGFDPNAMLSCYGLAEATLLVSGGPAGSGARAHMIDGRTRIASGIVAPDQEVLIVDPDSHEALGGGGAGEVWIRGAHVGAGYWNRPQLSEAVFGATLAGKPDGPRYLRTGDIGSIVDGDLVITGRLKDVIIIRGVKHHPEAIEETVEGSHILFRSGTAVAFGISEERESLVVALELGRARAGQAALDEARKAAVAAIINEHGVRPDTLLIVSPASLPRTTSGKVQRARCRDLYNSGAFAGRFVKTATERVQS